MLESNMTVDDKETGYYSQTSSSGSEISDDRNISPLTVEIIEID